MTKFDVAVGDEFPLDESAPDDGRGRRRHGCGHHHEHHGHHHRRHPFHIVGFLARLAVIAGIVALLVSGKIPAMAAYGMIGLGVAVMLVLGFVRARHFRKESP